MGTTLFGSAGTAEILFQIPLIISPVERFSVRQVAENGSFSLHYNVTDNQGKHWIDDDGIPYHASVSADSFPLKFEHSGKIPLMQSLFTAAKRLIDPLIAEHQWEMRLLRTDRRGYFSMKILADSQPGQQAPELTFCPGTQWHWKGLFQGNLEHLQLMEEAFARD
jgi:hypothetical protein